MTPPIHHQEQGYSEKPVAAGEPDTRTQQIAQDILASSSSPHATYHVQPETREWFAQGETPNETPGVIIRFEWMPFQWKDLAAALAIEEQKQTIEEQKPIKEARVLEIPQILRNVTDVRERIALAKEMAQLRRELQMA